MNLSIQASLQAQTLRLTALDHALHQQMQQPLPAAPSRRNWLKRVARAFIGVYVVQTLAAAGPVWAQVSAAPGAVAGQKPLIDAAANGVPIVHIAPPSAAGVSRNQYQQFNVPGNGLILNNSNTSVQTQQGGWITGNLQLGLTPARIILNEVVGPDASQLRGTLEVAGQRADIVIANPNGISCDGCGFLNTAGRTTLAAGQVRLGAGGTIEGFDASGHLSVGTAGLNAAEQEQLDLIARGLVIEGEVWARNLNVIAGANQVLYGTLQAVTGTASTSSGPLFAVDIKQLGGMYANQIYMVATDKGLGVNSTGRVAALQGNLMLSANGDLALKDSYAAKDLGLKSAGTVTLNGQTLADATVRIEAPAQVTNRGALQAPTLQLDAPRLDNSGSIAQTTPGQNLTLTLPGGLQNTGQIYTPGDLVIQAGVVSGSGSTAGQLVAGGSLQLSATQLQLAGQQLAANGSIEVQAQTLTATNGSMNAGANISLGATSQLDVTGTTLQSNGQTRLSGAGVALDRARIGAVGDVLITSTGVVSADASDIGSNAALTIQGSRVDLRSATMTAVVTAGVESGGELRLDGSQIVAGQRVALRGQGLSTEGATVAAGAVALDAGAGALNNRNGKIQASSTAADALSVQATGINNQGGELRANGGLTLDARGGLLDNSAGLVAGTSGTLSNLGGLTNKGGVLYTQSDLRIASTALDNSQGAIVTTGSLTVTTPGQAINNTAGLLQAGGAVTLDSGSADLRNAGGQVVAGADLTVHAGAVDSRDGSLVAGGTMGVTADTLQAEGATLGSGGAMNLTTTGEADLGTAHVGAGSHLTIAAGAVQATGADLASNGNLQVTGGRITGGHWAAQGQLTARSQGTLDLTGGALLAGGGVSAQGAGIVTDRAEVSGQTVSLNAGAGSLSNVQGQISANATSGTALSVTAAGIDNTGGTLASSADASLNAGGFAINNTGGRILVTGDLQMQASQLQNRNGTLSTASSLNIQGVALDNHGGTIQTQGHLTINTAGLALDNTAGRLVAGGDATLQAGALSNTGGTVSAGGSARVQATTLDTTSGRLSGARELDVLVTQRLSAGGATLATEGRLSAAAADIDALGATVLAGETLGLNATGALDIRQANVKAQGPQVGDLQVTGGSILATGATVAAGAGAALNSGGAIDLGAANLSALQGLTVQAGAALTVDAATLAANERLALSGAVVAATGATLSAGGQAEVTASAGVATLNNASLQAGDTASVTATGIAASGASLGAVNQVTLSAGTGDLVAPNALVQSQSGGISLNAANLTLAGSAPAGATPTTGLLAGQGIAITATGAVDLSRALTHAGANVSIATQGAITNNAGRIVAGGEASLTGASLDNQGGTLDANGAINLSASAGQVINDQGRISTRDVLTMGAPTGPLSSLSNADGVIETTGALNAQLQNFNNQGGRVVALAGLALSGGAVNNASGLLASDGNVSVNTQGGAFVGDNSKLMSTQGSLALTAGAATLSNAQLLAAQNISLTAGTTTLTASTLTSGGNITLAIGDLQASQVQINTQGQFNASANGAMTADHASIAAGGQASITATQGVDLQQSSLSAQTLQVNAGNGVLNNSAGSLVATGHTGTALTLQGQGLVNDGGTLASSADLTLNAGAGVLNNAAGRILAVGAADIRSTGFSNVAGTLAANGDLTINAAQANANAATDGTDGTLQSGQSLTLTAGATTLSNATVTSGGNTTLTTGDLQASQARINVLGDLNANASGAVTADQVALATGGNAAITAAQGIDINHGNVSAQNISLNAGSGQLNNSAGRLIATASTGTALSLQSQGLNNDAGTIASGAGLSLNASTGSVTNTSGSIQAMGAADIRSTGLNNRAGTIAANGDLTINAVQANANAATDSTDGTLQSGQSLTLTAGATTLSNATVTSGGNTTLTTGDLQASQARINVLGNLSVTAAGAVTAGQTSIATGGNATVAAAQGLDLNHASVDGQTLNLGAGSGLLNNAAGRLVASASTGTAVTLQGQGLNNDGGTIASGADLSANAGAAALSNAAGSLVAVGAATVRATGLNNVDGTIASNGALVVDAAQANAATRTDNTRGTIRSAQSSLTLTTGELLNSRVNSTDAGSVINAATDLTLTANGPVDNSRSEILAGNDLRINATGTLLNGQARLVAGRDLAVNASGVDNTAALVAGNRNTTLVVGAGGLTNTNGTVQASNNLAIASTGSVGNNGGQLLAGGQLDLAAGALTNSQGLISAQTGNATLAVTSYTNAAGSVLAGGALDLNTQGGALTANGATFASGAGMTLRAGAAQLNDANLTAGGTLDAQATSVDANRANVQAAGVLTVNAGTGTFNAAGSQWLANQSVALSGGAVGLTDAMVSANTSVAIAGASIDATRASLTSPGDVSVVASNGALNLSAASLLAGRDLTATGTGAGVTTGAQALAGRDLTLGNGANFDFGAAGLQYQFGRDLTVHAQGISTAGQQVAARNLTLDAGNGLLNNQGGTLQATGTLSASGNGLNNQSGVVAANGVVAVAAGAGTLNNTSGQIYSTQDSTSVSGAVIDNATGTVSAALDVNLTGGSLNNAGNTIAAGRNLTASLSGAVNNTGGKLIANTGAASVTANGINNQSGTISGATSATAHAGSGTLANTGGLVTGQNVTIGGAVLNSAGVISGSNSVAMTTLALNNDAGVIESGTGGISINTQGNTLTNTNSGSTRGIVSQGAITIAAGDINNQAGYIGANGGLSITQSTGINNQGGTLLGLGSSSITTSGTLNNQGGSILSGADLSVNAGTLNNSNSGTVYAARDLSVSATAIDNSNTKNGSYTTGLLAGRNATITAGTINNTNGAIVGLGETTVRATTSLNNSQGQIAGNVLTIDTPVMTNTAGRADAQQRLNLQVPQFSADGVLASNGALTLQLQGNYTNSGTVSANGDLSITTTGNYTNQGHVSAQNSLSLSASGIDNQSGAVIDSRVTTLTTSGTVNNAGLINSTAGQTSITAGTLNNTGRIYGDSIAVTGTTNNSIGAGGSAVIASRSGDVTFNGTLNNTDGALVMSLGNLQINGSAFNQGSTLNAQRNLTITGALTNTNAGFATTTQTRTEAAAGLYITPSGDTTEYKATDLVWVDHSGGHYVLPSTTYPLGTYGGNPRPGAIQCGLDGIGGEGGSYVCHYGYTVTDPIWSLMHVTSPGEPPASPGGTCMVFTGGEDGSLVRDMTGACGAYWNSVDAYDTATAAAYAQLDTAITAFNTDLNTRTLIDWYETTITGKTITETKVTVSNPGTVLAGGNISIGGGTNVDSVIVAGGSLNGGALQNQATQGTRETAIEGTKVFNHRVFHGGLSDSYSREISAPQPIADAPVTTHFDLPILQFESSGSPNAPVAGGTSTPVGGATAIVPSGLGVGASGARSATPVGGATGALQGGNATASGGGAVQVDTTAAGQPQGGTQVTGASVTGGGAVSAAGGNAPAGGPATVTPGTGNTPAGAGTVTAGGPGGPAGITTGSGSSPVTGNTTVNAGGGATPTGTGAITASLSAAPQAALPGSVIAGGVRAGQLAAITTSLTHFASAAATLPTVAATVNTNARQVAPAMVKAAGYTTVTVSGAVRAPNNQLFRLNTQPGARYLVETDPAFTNYRNWVSSDYFLTQLNLDPERTLKRYGDGFAEQRLIDDQILALTGRRFLGDYTSTEDEYQALLDAGVLFAQTYHLTPGVALSAEQMAALTTDIVWLENKTVTLPDGSTTLALVPTVYLRRPVAGDLTPSGALIAGSNVTLRSPAGSAQDLANTGTIIANGSAAAGNGKLTLEGQNVSNGGTLAGNVISVSAAQTLNNTGGVIQGLGEASSISLNARDILLRTTVQTSSASIQGPNGESTGTRTNVDRVATVSAGSVTLAALGNINLQGASVNASGNLNISAGGNLTSDAVQTGYTLNIPLGGAGGTTQGRTGHYEVASTTQQLTSLQAENNLTLAATGDASFKGTNASANTNLSVTAQNISIEAVKDSLSIDQQGVNKKGYERVAKADETLAGGSFTAGNNLNLTATGGDIKATGALVSADEGAATLTATGNIALQNATTDHSTQSEYFSSRKGLLSSESLQRDSASQATLAEASTVSGKTVAVVAGTNINIQGSGVVSDTQTTLSAGRDVSLKAATETLASSSFFEEKKSGLGALGGLSFGKRELSTDGQDTATRAAASTVGSLSGNVSITAGNAYTQVGSDVMTPQGNIDITAKTVSITEARETASSETEQKFKQTGISVSVGGALLDTGRTVANVVQAAGQTSDTRMQALAGATAALAVYNNAKDIQGAANALAKGDLKGAGSISITLGTSKSESHSQQQSDSTAGSSVAAGGNIAITARGAGATSDITVQGSTIQAGGSANLKSDGQVNLLAAANTASSQSSQSSSSASVGVSIGAGGLSASVAASRGSGNGNGSDTSWTNTQVQGNTVTIQSAGDTSLKGAVVAGNTVTAVVGGNLSIESLQDTSTYHDRSSSSGFGLTIPITGGTFGASVSGGKTNIDSNYQSVTEQSAIRAGDGGFHVSVDGATTLTGGAITSTQKAVDQGGNSFTSAGGVTLTDIQNSASYNANSVGGTIGVGSQLASSGAGVGKKDGDASSTTQAAISGVAGNAAARTGDAETGIQGIFDLTSVKNDVNAQVAITTAFGQQAPRAVAIYASGKAAELRQQGNEDEARKWDEGGAYRIALHTALGALSGGVAGAAAAGAVASAAPLIDQLQAGVRAELVKAGASDTVAQIAGQLIGQGTATAIGAVAGGGVNGAVVALNIDTNNRQLHPSEVNRIKDLAAGDPEKEARLKAAACALVRCADGVPIDDPNYPLLKAMQDAGQGLTAEKTLLGQQKVWVGRNLTSMFQHDWLDSVGEAITQNNTGTRLVGAVQAGAGVAGVVGSAALCTSGLGCLAAGVTGTVSADYAVAGAIQAGTGRATTPYGEQVLQSLGLSPGAAALAYGMTGLAPLLGQAVIVTRLVNAEAAAATWARGTYEGTSAATFEGTVYRVSLPERSATTWEITKYNVVSDHRYTGPGVGAVYGGTSPATAVAEVTSYDAPLAGRIIYSREIAINNVLDLTDPVVRRALNLSLSDLTQPSHGGAAYVIPQRLGQWAREQGYNAILAPSAQNATGANLISFKALEPVRLGGTP
ncbi:MAG: hemagglutinin repeat-containing protein [Ramlibacter sp.]|nr:hemagglutinin repeat-containing protein [Ramlibacter sp.]